MSSGQILVVEDNEKNMKLFRDVLQATGYATLEARTGEDAVELAVAHSPALVLMDVQLPGIDGVEALVRLREDERTASIPVLALTAQAMQGDRERFLAAGFDGYISKPIDVAELPPHGRGALPVVTERPARILVVDDVPENVRLLEAVLTPRGYDVLTASDGIAALEVVELGPSRPDPARRDDARPGRLCGLQPGFVRVRRLRCCR